MELVRAIEVLKRFKSEIARDFSKPEELEAFQAYEAAITVMENATEKVNEAGRKKIIIRDNFDRPNVSDILVADNVHTLIGKDIVDMLNARESERSSDFYDMVDSSYKLRDGSDVYK